MNLQKGNKRDAILHDQKISCEFDMILPIFGILLWI